MYKDFTTTTSKMLKQGTKRNSGRSWGV